jgi:hypothetical protein
VNSFYLLANLTTRSSRQCQAIQKENAIKIMQQQFISIFQSSPLITNDFSNEKYIYCLFPKPATGVNFILSFAELSRSLLRP